MEYLLNGTKNINIKKFKKMEKIYFKETGKEVQMGDTLTVKFEMKTHLLGDIIEIIHIKLTEETLPQLLKAGIIITKPTVDIPMDIQYYINKAINRLKLPSAAVTACFAKINNTYPGYLFSIILKEIAIELDKKYEDHIKNSPVIYGISTTDGRIFLINKKYIKNYKNFAAFRSVEDAKIACKIVKDTFKDMFKNE